MSIDMHQPAFPVPEGTAAVEAGLTKLEYASIKIASGVGPLVANPQAVAKETVELARLILEECDNTV